jgi:dipeptidyl aminopeptidase/acylaminoacyl peptidase
MAHNLKFVRSFLVAATAVFVSAAAAPAQTSALFTIDDYFKVVSLRIDDWSKDGHWLAGTLSRPEDRIPGDNTRSGDPTYLAPIAPSDLVVIDASDGKQVRVFPGKEQYRGVAWSPDGKKLAMFLYRKSGFQLAVWNRDTRQLETTPFKLTKAIAANSPLVWTSDGSKLIFSVRAPDWEEKSAEAFKSVTSAAVRVFDSEKPFLPWDEVGRRGRLAIPVVGEIASGNIVEILPETPIGSSRITEDGRSFVYERDVTEKTNYDVIGGTSNQLEIIPLAGGTARVLLKPAASPRSMLWAKNNLVFAYVEKGDVFVMNVADKEPRQLTGEKESALKVAEDKKTEARKKRTFAVSSFSPSGRSLLCTSARPQEDEEKEKKAKPPNPPREYWLIDAVTGVSEMVYELPEKEEDRPNLQLVDWSPDGRSVYFSVSATNKYDRGLLKLDLRTRKMSDLLRSSRLLSRWRMAEDGSRFLYWESDGDRPEELFTTDANFEKPTKLTDLNPELKDKALSRTELISYRDADGKTLYGVLYYPALYEKGKKYPLITEVYETYFDNGFSSTLNIFTSAGYAVLHPSVNFTTGYPGEAWAKGALAAINKVVDMGVADPDKLGLQGTSYGGYATVLLLTQTDRFKAAINNSGKVDLLSFYTQSPRLGVRNTHAPEKSQDRIGGTLWEYPERYLAQSAILQADRIKTPLLCITGDLDPNVEAVQSQEIFTALRRLGKKCVWLNYRDGAHGGPNTNEERKDMFRRMLDWYDTYLVKGSGAP